MPAYDLVRRFFEGLADMTMLSVKELERLKSADAGKRLTDEHSLYGVVKSKIIGGAVIFRWRYRFEGNLRDFKRYGCCGRRGEADWRHQEPGQ